MVQYKHQLPKIHLLDGIFSLFENRQPDFFFLEKGKLQKEIFEMKILKACHCQITFYAFRTIVADGVLMILF